MRRLLYVVALGAIWAGCSLVLRPDPGCKKTGCPDGQKCVYVKPDEAIILPGYYDCRPIPSPTPSPTPSPSPTPVPTPTPTPEPTPTPSPVATPTPSPSPTPKPPVQWCNKDGSPRTGAPSDCSTCQEKQDWEVSRGNWVRLPPSHPFKGITGDECAILKPGCTCLDSKCNRVDCVTGRILAPAEDGWFGNLCVQCPAPSPTPTPTPGPSPTPPPAGDPCSAPVIQMGGSMLSPRDCGRCRDDGYLGYVTNYTATPLVSGELVVCFDGEGHRRNRCEQPKQCQDPRGATIYITLPGKFTNDLCDERSDNPFNCHHKPKADEVGVTTFTSCPKDAPPTDPRCVSKKVDIRPDKPVEVK